MFTLSLLLFSTISKETNRGSILFLLSSFPSWSLSKWLPPKVKKAVNYIFFSFFFFSMVPMG